MLYRVALYVIATDAPCAICHEQHGVVTRGCKLAAFVDYGTAMWISQEIEGSVVKEIDPDQLDREGIDHTLYLHKQGRADSALPKTQVSVHSRRATDATGRRDATTARTL